MAEWYIIHTLSGTERRIKDMILDQAAKKNMSDFFEDIVIPAVESSEVRRGKLVKVEKKIMPGYIMIKMNMTDESWHLVKNVAKTADFLGEKSKPKPLSLVEVENIFNQIESRSEGDKVVGLYSAGQQLVIVDGPFEGFLGTVEAVDGEKSRVKVAVSIFGKETSIDLSFSQVKKNNNG